MLSQAIILDCGCLASAKNSARRQECIKDHNPYAAVLQLLYIILSFVCTLRYNMRPLDPAFFCSNIENEKPSSKSQLRLSVHCVWCLDQGTLATVSSPYTQVSQKILIDRLSLIILTSWQLSQTRINECLKQNADAKLRPFFKAGNSKSISCADSGFSA